MEHKTANQILDIAQEIVSSRGYSAFSYADIADRVGIRKASIHYHFPSKDDLVLQLVRRYRLQFGQACEQIGNANCSPQEQLFALAAKYRDGLGEGQICLCAMLTADYTVLSKEVREELQLFFQEAEQWVAQVLGKIHGISRLTADTKAKGLVALFSGAQLLARIAPNPKAAFDCAVSPWLTN